MFKKIITLTLLTSAITSVGFAQGKATSEAFGKNVQNSNITELEIEAAQEAWGKALIQINKDFETKGLKKATETASAVLDSAYGYSDGTVLFKPTLAYGDQTFRLTKESALAYFVGGNKKYPNDKGFALKGWVKYEYKNAAVYINADLAITTGHVFITDNKGVVTKIDKTWGFKRNNQGKLKIILHHSSLPYSP